MVLTPKGPVAIENLRAGDILCVPPDARQVPIEKIYSSLYVGDRETAPCRIPKDFFEPNMPDADILLSPHHMYFYQGKWNLPKFNDGMPQEISLYGKEFLYYHIQLPNYATDKLWCQNLPLDSWEEGTDPVV